MLRRLINLIRGWFGLGLSELEKLSPDALLEIEKENLRKQIAQYNRGLAAHAGLCEKLIAQVKDGEKRERELAAKIKVLLTTGSRDAASQYAMQLQTLRVDLAENRRQLDEAEKTYKELVKARDVSVNAARAKIESLKASLSDLQVKKATAELNEMASGMISEIGGAGDTLNRLHEMVEEERTKAAGRARVARDSIDMGDVHLKEAEQKALADQALAEFAAAEGIALEPASGESTPAAPVEKSMGPAQSA